MLDLLNISWGTVFYRSDHAKWTALLLALLHPGLSPYRYRVTVETIGLYLSAQLLHGLWP